MAQSLILGGSRHRAVAQIHLEASKLPRGLVGILLKKGHLRHQAINLAPLWSVRAWWGRPLRLEDFGQGALWPTASRAKTHPTRSVYDQAADQSVSQPSASQRVVHTLHTTWRKLIFVSALHQTGLDSRSMTQRSIIARGLGEENVGHKV